MSELSPVDPAQPGAVARRSPVPGALKVVLPVLAAAVTAAAIAGPALTGASADTRLAAATTTIGPAPVHVAPPRRTGTPRPATTSTTLGHNPALVAGTEFSVVAPGFQAGSIVVVRVDRSTTVRARARVTSRGVARIRLVLPATLGAGQHRLVIAGHPAVATPSARARSASPSRVSPSSTTKRVVIYPFRVTAGIG